MDNGTAEQEDVKRMKRRMERWREVILPLYSILLWERNWHPGLIFGLVTTIFGVIWILEPFLLTIISICFLALSLTDYLVPIAISVLCNPQNWTGQKEKKLIEISQNVSATLAQIKGMWNSFLKLQLNHPHMYKCAMIASPILFLWIRDTVNHWLMFYILVSTILLTPGLRHKERAYRALRCACNRLLRRH